jgi:hypothetical protein
MIARTGADGMGTAKTPVLFQNTRFCEFAGMMVERRHRGKVLCEPLRSYGEGVELMKGYPHGAPAMLIWGDGTCHHLSNVLNVASSVKCVFDNHDDSLEGGQRPEYDSHNRLSREGGVRVRVCRGINGSGRHSFSSYDEGDGNGLLHISTDLDFVRGFPALPWMSVGGTGLGALLRSVGELASSAQLRRFDIGGYHELGSLSEIGMRSVYVRYYEPLVEAALGQLMHVSALREVI